MSIYKEVNIVYAAQICGIWMKENDSRNEIRARCPFCDTGKGKPTASINKHKNLFYCFRCSEGHGSISLFAKVTGSNTKQAYRELLEAAA
jgi:DNA primase